jgi:nitrite reductase/ring-hydroxylating ferredoxin subunit
MKPRLGDDFLMQRRRVCGIDELPPGTMKLVPAGRFGVGVYNVNGEFYAIANYCAHEGAPLCAGFVGGTNVHAPDRPGQLMFVREGQIVRCPWHQWEFDLTTGHTLADSTRKIRTYRVDVDDGEVFVTA